MDRSKDVKAGCIFTMRVSLFLVCVVLCFCQPWVVYSAPLNVSVSTADGNNQPDTNQTVTTERPYQPNGVDRNAGVLLKLTQTSMSLNTPSQSTSITTTTPIKDVNYTKDVSTSANVTTPGAVSSTTSAGKYTEKDSILSSTNGKLFLSDSTSTTKATTSVSKTQGTVKTSTTSAQATSRAATTTQRKVVVTTASASVISSTNTESQTTNKETVKTPVAFPTKVTVTIGTTKAKPNTSVPRESVSQIVSGATDVTVLPVIPGTNTTLNPVTRSVVSGSPQVTSDPIVNANTFEVVDPKTYTPPTKVGSTVSAHSGLGVGAPAAKGSPSTTALDQMAGMEVSSGEDIFTFPSVSTDKDSDLPSTTLPQTAASNTTSFVTSNKMNLTTLTNTSIYITTPITKDEMFSSTAPTSTSSTTPPVTDATTQQQTEDNRLKTTTPVMNTQPPPPPGGKEPSGKEDENKKPVDQGSLTIILLVLCASLLALLLALCVFTYVKFRKKSRSIRKRLTFKDDSIYDNPIYHGRWEVPKAPEPTSSSCPRSLPMLISALPDEVVRLSKDGDTGFRVQFMMLDKLSPNSPRTVATTDMNTHKNRYRDILPFDHNRVKLTEEGDKSDYINASFVPGVKSEREYITCQGPLERTAADHWRMIWEMNIRVIAMLTTCEEGDLIFKSKCFQYWPNKENDSVNYDGIYVTLVSTARLCRDNYKQKVLHIRKGKDSEPRKVQLFQYIKWPDRKNPEDPEAFLDYREHVKREMGAFDEQSPLLVHCSAGVGRTGTFIAIDTLLQHMEERESIDVYGLVLRLRKYRVLLVQNSSQYKFVHTCLLIILDKMKKAEVDENQKKAGLDGSYPYENMVMGQRAVVGELGGLVHGGDSTPAQSSAVQSFLRKTKTNVQQPHVEPDDQQCGNSDGMPSPVKIEEWPRPLSDPVPRPVIETPKSKPFSGGTKGDPERALAKELGGMFQGGVERHASPGKTAAIKAFLRNRDLESETVPTNSDHNPNGDSLVIDNRFREEAEKQTTCL